MALVVPHREGFLMHRRPDNPTANGCLTPALSSFQLDLPPAVLRPLIAEVVREVLAALEADRATLPDKLAYSEAEAARLLSLNPHQLRDERLRGRIAASAIVGGRIRYTRADLLDYLAARRSVVMDEK
jgi:hypothetical protein